MKDPKAIRRAIMTAKSVARLIDPRFGRVPLPELGSFTEEKPFPEHSPMVHEAYGEPMPEHFAIGGPALSAYNAAKRADYEIPPEGAKAIEDFIGVGPDALKTRVWGGIMQSDPLEDAYSEEPSEHGRLVRQQLHEGFSPIREKLRDIFGDHVTLYRHQHDTEGHSRGHRNTLSWTIDPKVAEWFAGIRHKEKPLYSDEDIENAHQEFLRNGKVKIGRHTLVHNPESPYPEIWDDHEMVTDVDSVPEYMNWENEWIKEDNDRIAKKRARIKKAKVPLDDVIWASNRAGQREFIVHNRPDAPHYINEQGEMPNAEPEHFADGGRTEEVTGAELMNRIPELAENPPEMEKHFASAPAKPLSEMSAKYLRKGEMEDWYEKHPEKLVEEGAILFPALGDLTAADRKLLEIGGKKLTKPVDLTGGGEYQRSPKRGAWASRALTAAMNAKKMAAQNPEGRPAYMVHTTMGLPSGDSSHMMAQSLLRLIPAMEISSKAAKAFDAVMRKDDPQWPGILNTEAAEKHLLRKDSKGGKDYTGTRVSNFLKTFDKADWRNWGFPGLGEIRFATAEKRLLSAPQGSAGFSLARVRPEKGIYEEEEPHETYSGAFHKDEEQGYGGGFKHIVPATAMFSDWAKRQPKTFTKKSTGEKIPITKTMLQQALMTQHPAQIANQEWLDTVMPEYEKKKKWGYKEGGTVKRAVSIAKSLKKK